MNKNDQLEKVIALLEDKCINNVDEHFDQFLLNDMSDIGGPFELFTDQDRYLFFWECAKELYQVVQNCLFEENIIKSNLLRLVRLKRIVDGKLLEFGNNDIQEIERDLGLRFTLSNNQPIIIQNENVQASFFQNLYNQLFEKKFINNTKDEFLSNFNQSEEYTPINWIEKQITLVTLLRALRDNDIISIENKEVGNFVKHLRIKGKPIKTDSISKTIYRIEKDSIMYIEFDLMIKICNK